MLASFSDWSKEVCDAKKKIVLLQGHHDPNAPIMAAQSFLAQFPDFVELVEIEDGGGLLEYTHPETVFKYVNCEF